jgi:predicted peptidase
MNSWTGGIQPNKKMRLGFILAFFAILTGFLLAQPQKPVVHRISSGEENLLSLNPDYLVFPPNVKSSQSVPLLIYLHGSGGGFAPLERIGGQARTLLYGIKKFGKGPCYVVVPQCFQKTKSGSKSTWEPADLNILFDDLLEKFPIDPNRVYLTGNSMGGYGCWAWGGHSPQRFAAIAPVVGGIGPHGPKDISPDISKWASNLAQVPVYAFAGGLDRVVPPDRSERMINEIRKAGGKHAKIKIYPEGGHNVRQLVYNGHEFYDWMFSHSRATLKSPK